MLIKQDSVTKLWCREDGAILMPPDGYKFKKFRWTFGTNRSTGYRTIEFHGRSYRVHRLVCQAFNGLPHTDKPEVDHINRIKGDNRPDNLRWANRKENEDNKNKVDASIAKYGVRACEDPNSYRRERYNRDPEYAERCRAYKRKRYATDPEYAERQRASSRECNRKRRAAIKAGKAIQQNLF